VAYIRKAVEEVPEKPKGRFTDAAFQSFVAIYGSERDELVKLAKAYAYDNDSIYYEHVRSHSSFPIPIIALRSYTTTRCHPPRS
jgi:hypothetical protein